jgi:hypothetical protein
MCMQKVDAPSSSLQHSTSSTTPLDWLRSAQPPSFSLSLCPFLMLATVTAASAQSHIPSGSSSTQLHQPVRNHHAILPSSLGPSFRSNELFRYEQ